MYIYIYIIHAYYFMTVTCTKVLQCNTESTSPIFMHLCMKHETLQFRVIPSAQPLSELYESECTSLEGVQSVDDCYLIIFHCVALAGFEVTWFWFTSWASCIVTDVYVSRIDLRWPFFDRNFWVSPVPLADYSPFWQQRTLRVCTMSAMCESMWQRVRHSRT